MELPKDVRQIIETLENAGYEAYAVGGCVRDMVLKRVPKDWDITTSARPEQVKGFCESVEEKEDAELTVIVTAYLGGFTVYNLKTTEGRVTVDRGYYQYEKN